MGEPGTRLSGRDRSEAMERCPACGQMTYAYDYRRQSWVCVCYDCNEERPEDQREHSVKGLTERAKPNTPPERSDKITL